MAAGASCGMNAFSRVRMEDAAPRLISPLDVYSRSGLVLQQRMESAYGVTRRNRSCILKTLKSACVLSLQLRLARLSVAVHRTELVAEEDLLVGPPLCLKKTGPSR